MTATFSRLASASILSAALLLTACGGGGGGGGGGDTSGPVKGGDVVSDLTFHPLAGYKARIDAGANDTFNVKYMFASGANCVGTANITTQAKQASTFEGVDSYAVKQDSTLNCGASSSSATGNTYYDVRNYGQLGLESNSSPLPSPEYDVYTGLPDAPPALPATAKVGATGTLATYNVYKTKEDKTTPMGTREISFAIEPDTAQTAMLNIINKAYDASQRLLSTQQSRYKMAEDGTLTYYSIDVQYATTSQDHIEYTKPQ
jgi:hypothetical protein